MENIKIEHEFDVYLESLDRLVSCPSVIDESGDKPFGKGINDALDTVLDIAKSWGYRTFKSEDGMYGYAEVGDSDIMMGVLGHVDVVSVGDVSKWTFDPFKVTLHEGMLYGRGVQDDKGPVLANMFALKLLLDAGKTLKHTVRFIFGTDEESQWRCMDSYKKHERLPDYGITPDADFPLVQVEKGTVSFLITDLLNRGEFLEGGVSGNAVPNAARTKHSPELIDALKQKNTPFEVQDDYLIVQGVAAHASTPEQGKNAIVKLIQAKKEIGELSPLEAFIDDLYSYPIFDRFYDNVSGYLTHNIGIVRTEDTLKYATLDIRYPVSFEKFEIVSLVEKYASKHNLKVETKGGLPSIQLSEKSEVFRKLYEAYQEVTGDLKTKPLKIGGATYARAMPNIVAYGMLLPGAPMTMHQVDESISVDDVKTAIKIYATAFDKLVF
ncbi:Sapep family Mn(2+)-dependent dipeptidase [Erysipelothrix larvae]|uniref:Sapep family Mn(2+)-dependent dipeptidase n=1 Tax=Erysipelothrix larvae TaxID=1514105 RepID=UPI00082AAFDC|nr:Sapep family Mn(2+)-dependent dipeptidase [Erysipelothrix larvae]